MDYSDGGYKSRKLHMAYVVIALITLGFLATGKWSSLSVSYGEFIMGVLAAASIYAGSNSVIKWMSHKSSVKKTKVGNASTVEVQSTTEMNPPSPANLDPEPKEPVKPKK